MRALGRSKFTVSFPPLSDVLGMMVGIFMIWLYAIMRERYGAGAALHADWPFG